MLILFEEARPAGKLWNELSDSLKRQISLKSYVLLSSNQLHEMVLLRESGSYFALDARAKNTNAMKLFARNLNNTDQYVPILGDSVMPRTQIPEGCVWINSGEINSLHLTKSDSLPENEWPVFSVHPLLMLEASGSTLPDSMLLNLWQTRGKMPNFISHDKLEEVSRSTKFLNNQRRIFGIVSSEEGPLSTVLLKDFPSRIISGHFSMPVLGPLILKPYKAGYQFSPDVIYNAPNNERNSKVFRAIQLESKWELTDHFAFSNNKIENLCRSDQEEIITQNVSFIDDEQRDAVAYFKNAYIDAGISSKAILSSAFSISVWIKPYELGENNSILGKGTNFVIKIRRGKLTFTMAGIKDYISENTPVELGKWTHVAVVYSEQEKNIKFYLNGKKTDQINLIANYTGSDHSLLIGSNLWEEFFSGCMDDVRIWERELNEQEIIAEYQRIGSEKKSKWWYSLLILLVIPAFGFRKYFKPIPPATQIEKETPAIINANGLGDKILCFGGLRIICPDGTDISRKLSPKLKQLFVLILLHSGPGKKGISSKKMSELLWPGMSTANAKNIRGTNMQNLRQVLAPCTGLSIAFNDKMWSLETTSDFYCDYYQAEELLLQIENTGSSDQLHKLARKLTRVLKNGKFLPAVEASWMDTYHERFSNRILELCLSLPKQLAEPDYTLELELADIAGLYDELNETVLKTKVRILTAQGKHSLAEIVYKSYIKLYAELYKSDYPVDFRELLK